MPPAELWPQLDAIEAAIQRQDVSAAMDLLAGLVPEWKRADGKLPRIGKEA